MSVAETPAAAAFCTNCGSADIAKFCPRCGETTPSAHDYSVLHFASHAVHDLTHFDTKFFRTLTTLIRRPGELTAAYFEGRRTPYLTPVQLFIWLNVIFFFLAPSVGILTFTLDHYVANRPLFFAVPAAEVAEVARGERGMSAEQFRGAFDASVDQFKRSFIFIMVPPFALVLALILVRRKRFMVEHLVFALHYWAFWLVTLLLSAALFLGGTIVVVHVTAWLTGSPATATGVGEAPVILTLFAASLVYLSAALRRFYALRRGASVAIAAALTVVMFYDFILYRDALFFLTLKLMG